jgi:hypothetical protein
LHIRAVADADEEDEEEEGPAMVLLLLSVLPQQVPQKTRPHTPHECLRLKNAKPWPHSAQQVALAGSALLLWIGCCDCCC